MKSYAYLFVVLLVSISYSYTDNITITVLNDYEVTVDEAGGICYVSPDYPAIEYLMIVDYGIDYIIGTDPNNGTVISYLGITPEIPDGFGIAACWDDTLEIYLNDWNTIADIYLYNNATVNWSWAFYNPTASSGRGMSLDTHSYIWEITGYRSLFRFDTSGNNVSVWPLDELPNGEGFACATYPHSVSTTGILVNCFESDYFYLYFYDSGNFSFYDSVAVPFSPCWSIDLTYSKDRLSFFWLWMYGGSTHITEFELELPVTLQTDTWASIKSLEF